MNIAIDTQRYFEEGAILFETPIREKMTAIRKIFLEVFDWIASTHGEGPIKNDADIVRLYRGPRRDLWVAAYDQLSNLPEVVALCDESWIRDTLKQIGFKRPALPLRNVVRADMPSDAKWDISNHQDYVYHYGSNNSVTYWLPFQDVPIEVGALEIAKGTHLGGAKPQEKGILKSVEGAKFESIPAKVGQALLFSQFLFHRSGKNSSNQIRFSIQIRFNDLGAEDYQKRLFYSNWDDLKRKNTDAWYETSFPRPVKVKEALSR